MAKFRINDDDQEAFSLEARQFYDPSEDKTRQELFPETALNLLLQRYQPFELPARETTFGTVDYDLDRHAATLSLRDANDALASDRRKKKASEASAASAEGSGASPSDSAAAQAAKTAKPGSVDPEPKAQ